MGNWDNNGIWLQGILQRIIQGIKNITTLITIYVLFVLFVVNNRDYFVSYNIYYNKYTGQRNDLHLPQVPLALYQKAVCYSGFKTFNDFPKAIKDIFSKPNKFKIALNHFLQKHSLYSLGEFFYQTVIFQFISRIYMKITSEQ